MRRTKLENEKRTSHRSFAEGVCVWGGAGGGGGGGGGLIRCIVTAAGCHISETSSRVDAARTAKLIECINGSLWLQTWR